MQQKAQHIVKVLSGNIDVEPGSCHAQQEAFLLWSMHVQHTVVHGSFLGR